VIAGWGVIFALRRLVDLGFIFFGTGSDFGPVVDQIRRIGLSLVRSTGVHRIDLAGAPPIWVVVSAVSR
jgi:hypothetical protein